MEAKEVDADGDHVVKLTTWATNQREPMHAGTAVIAAASRCRRRFGQPATRYHRTLFC